MSTSPEAVKKIAEFEGVKLKPYNDLSNNATVGVGHLLHKGPLNGTEVPVTSEQAMLMFADDLKNLSEKYIAAFIKTPLNQNQFDALSSFCYNLGCGTLKTLVSETGLNDGKYDAVPSEILKYSKSRVKGVLAPVDGLTRRRQWESELFKA